MIIIVLIKSYHIIVSLDGVGFCESAVLLLGDHFPQAGFVFAERWEN